MNKIIIVFLFLSNLLFAQVTADLTIENQQALGADFFFDIYITGQVLIIFILVTLILFLHLIWRIYNSPQ